MISRRLNTQKPLDNNSPLTLPSSSYDEESQYGNDLPTSPNPKPPVKSTLTLPPVSKAKQGPKRSRSKKLITVTLSFLLFLLLILLPGTLYESLTSDPDPCLTFSNLSGGGPKTVYNPNVPRIIHTQSKNFPLEGKEDFFMDSWRKVFPGPVILFQSVTQLTSYIETSPSLHLHIIWTDSSCLTLFTELSPSLLKTYTSLKTIEKIDTCRYLFLREFGGVYHDVDFEVLEDFWNVLPQGVGLVESPYRYNERVQNSLMSSSVGHRFWDDVLEEVSRRKEKNIEKPFGIGVLQTTGPSMLSDEMVKWQAKYDSRLTAIEPSYGPVSILDCNLFHRIPRGIYDTTYGNILAREYLTRLVPMKGCGNFKNTEDCQLTRHWGRASWTMLEG
ncbi:hypothetical protein TrST_g5010 [Triparma strigata]|uniref:Glycosyltransferase n=1 Tax=Triparma strigata TaxID=1606541 RepID=A0A9W7EDU9_9STRA|nr:hypothetical protein TrST_g5010 [Triparma strigata]